MPNLAELFREMEKIGYEFEIRSGSEHNLFEDFAWGGLTLQTLEKRLNEGYSACHWRYVYKFSVVATYPKPDIPEGWI